MEIEIKPRPGTPHPTDPVRSRPSPETSLRRLAALERFVRAIEAELADDELDDETTLRNIAERVANAIHG